MFVSKIIERVNSLSDDQIEDLEIVGFINDALDEIGREVNATFPSISEYGYEYLEPALPDKWVRLLIIPFSKGRVKEKDSSQFEWEVGYDTFITNMLDFKGKYKVPVEYRDLPVGTEFDVNGVTMYSTAGDTIYSIAEDENASLDSLKQQAYDSNGKLKFNTMQSYESDIFKNPPFYSGGAW